MMLPNSTPKPSPSNQRKEAIQQLDMSNGSEEEEEPAETEEDMPGVGVGFPKFRSLFFSE